MAIRRGRQLIRWLIRTRPYRAVAEPARKRRSGDGVRADAFLRRSPEPGPIPPSLKDSAYLKPDDSTFHRRVRIDGVGRSKTRPAAVPVTHVVLAGNNVVPDTDVACLRCTSGDEPRSGFSRPPSFPIRKPSVSSTRSTSSADGDSSDPSELPTTPPLAWGSSVDEDWTPPNPSLCGASPNQSTVSRGAH
jgi:hypothetical protein